MDQLDAILGLVNLQTVLVGCIMGLLTYKIYNKLKYKSPPGPWALPLIGNYKLYSSYRMHRDIAKLSETYKSPVIQIAMGPHKAVFLNSLDVVLEAVVKKKADFADRPITSYGIIYTEGGKDIAFAPYSATWKFQKKVAGRALRYYMQGTHLDNMLNDVCEKVFERMSKETEPFHVNEYLNKIAIHMLFNMCFGRKCDLESKEVARILELFEETIKKFGSGLIEDVIPAITYVYKTKTWRELEIVAGEFLAFLRKELKQHKDTFDSNNIRDYTDSLIKAKMEAETEERDEDVAMLSDVYIVQIVSDIFSAGLDTTRLTLDWFMSYMIAYPEFQEKCQAEIDQALGKRRFPSASDRPNFCFTEACIMETMRMGSVTGIGIPHSTLCDSSVGGYDISKGTMVFINYWALHNDPKFWKDVDKFDPYRYLTREGKMDMKPDNWLPFSAGRRVCLGETVARTELLLIAANLLQNFRFKAPTDVKHVTKPRFPIPGVELPEHFKVVVEKRNT